MVELVVGLVIDMINGFDLIKATYLVPIDHPFYHLFLIGHLADFTAHLTLNKFNNILKEQDGSLGSSITVS